MSDVIYENPDTILLPDWAQWMAGDKYGYVYIFEQRPLIHSGESWEINGKFEVAPPGYDLPSRWRNKLYRIIRLGDPAYYCAANPHTDDEGFLPHDGGPMPEWLSGKDVQIKMASGRVAQLAAMSGLYWKREDARDPDYCIIAYRIVGEGSEGRAPIQHEAIPGRGWVPPSDPDHPDYGQVVGSEGREAGDPIPSSSKSRLDFYTDQEVKHRNELAARLGVSVPGMSSWLEGPLREARRVRYREAALSAMASRDDLTGWQKVAAGYADSIADAMLDQETDHAE